MHSKIFKEWLDSNLAVLVPAAIADELVRCVEALPWSAGTRLDSEVIGGEEANLARLTGAQRVDWIERTSLRDDPYLIFLYRGGEPCIACEMKFGLENIEVAFGGAPGVRYLFGATIDVGTIRPNFRHVAEYDGADWLTVRR